ncbi:MAG TPA: hypothetical protein PLZ86_00260 [bacterium]|nr:hypothetical protein [bacterium]
MKTRHLMTVVVPLILALSLFGCDSGGRLLYSEATDGGSGGSDEPVDVSKVSCNAFGVLPAEAGMILSFRNIKDLESGETALDWTDPLWAGLLSAPISDLPEGDFIPSNNTLGAMIEDVFGDLALEKLGVGWYDTKCVGLSAISVDGQALALPPDERPLMTRIMMHLQDKIREGNLTLQFAFDGSNFEMDLWMAFLEDAIWNNIYRFADGVVWREITAERVANDESYAAFSNLVGDDFTCLALMWETDAGAAAQQIACQLGDLWFGIVPAATVGGRFELSPPDFTPSLDSMITLEQMIVNARALAANQDIDTDSRDGRFAGMIADFEAKERDITFMVDFEHMLTGSVVGLQDLTNMFKAPLSSPYPWDSIPGRLRCRST